MLSRPASASRCCFASTSCARRWLTSFAAAASPVFASWSCVSPAAFCSRSCAIRCWTPGTGWPLACNCWLATRRSARGGELPGSSSASAFLALLGFLLGRGVRRLQIRRLLLKVPDALPARLGLLAGLRGRSGHLGQLLRQPVGVVLALLGFLLRRREPLLGAGELALELLDPLARRPAALLRFGELALDLRPLLLEVAPRCCPSCVTCCPSASLACASSATCCSSAWA